MKVKFVPIDKEFEIKNNQTVLTLAQDNGIHIKSVCKGIPSCAECRVRIVEGEYNVLPPSSAEMNLIGTSYFVDQRRLSCQIRCFGDIVVDVTEQLTKAKEAVSSKRPRGYGPQKAPGESRAVMGNIILEDKDKKDKVVAAKDEDQSAVDVNERTANLSLQFEETRRELDKIKSRKKGPGE